MTKATRLDIAQTVDALHLLLVDDEREKVFSRSARAAVSDTREVLRAILIGELRAPLDQVIAEMRRR